MVRTAGELTDAGRSALGRVEVLLSAGHSSEDRLPGLSVNLVGERRIVPEGRVLTTPVRVEAPA